MAASNSNIKEPVMRTLIRFMNAVRKENTEQAAQLLRPHSAVERCCIVEYTSLLIPSSVKTIRSVIQSVYLNNKSASDEDLKEAAESVLWTESYILIYSTVIEYSPLLLAIKQGSADEVRSLLQQLPREEAVRLIINGPDVQLSVLSIANEAKYEEKVTDKIRRNYTLTDEQLTVIISFGLSELIKDAISMPTEFSALLSCLALAAARGSPEIIKLLHEFATSRDNRDFLTRSEYFFAFIGYIIASHSSHQAVVTMTEILLERIPADIIKQKVCIDWLIQCVCGGVSGVEVISLILKHTTWDEEVKNVIISLLINTWNFGTEKPIFAALLEKVPDNELGTFLTMDFDMKNFHFTDLSDWLFDTSKHSLLSAGKSSGAEKYIESCLSSTQLSAIAEYVKSSPNTVTSELLALINSHLSDYCIPDHPRAKLQMYGVVCFNEGQLALERNGAKKEAQTVTKAMQDIGIKTGNPIKNWSTYSLLMGLRKFCEDYRDKCSLAVVCIMTHGKAGLLYSNTSSSDSCQISDIFNILEERLPQVIPKLVIVQACQGLPADTCKAGKDAAYPHKTLDSVSKTDAAAASSGKDDRKSVHVEIGIPNTTLLMSTLHGHNAHRNHFIPALAEEIKKADGVRTVHDMFIAASNKMMSHPDTKYQHQIPEYRTSNRKNLILPRRANSQQETPIKTTKHRTRNRIH